MNTHVVGGMTIGPASLDDLERDRSARSRGLHRRPPVAPLAARLHPRAAPAADRRPLRRSGRGLRAAVGARGRPQRAHLFARRRPRPDPPRRRPRPAAGLRTLRARARARGAAARGALRQPGGDRPLREDRVSPVRPISRLLRRRRDRAAVREAAGAGRRRHRRVRIFRAAGGEAFAPAARRPTCAAPFSDAWCPSPPGARFASLPSRRASAFRSAREPTGHMIASKRDPALRRADAALGTP